MTTNVETTPWYKGVWFIVVSIIMILIILAGSITAIVLSVDGNGNGAPGKHLPDNGSEIEGLLSIKEHELFVKKELNLSNLSSNKSSLSYSIFYEYNGIIEVVAFVAKRDANLIFNLSVYGENISYYSECEVNDKVISKTNTFMDAFHEEVQVTFDITNQKINKSMYKHLKNYRSTWLYFYDDEWEQETGSANSYYFQDILDSNRNETIVWLGENVTYYDSLRLESSYKNISGSIIYDNEERTEVEDFDLNYLDFDYIEFSL